MDLDLPVVYVVDDDARICEAVSELLASDDLQVFAFHSITQFLAFERPSCTACLILDVRLPDDNGLNLQAQLAGTDHLPIIFITGHADVASSVRALKAGAVDFLLKPFDGQRLVQTVRTALERSRTARIVNARRARLAECFARLTPREREVLPLIVSGLLNKQAAALLRISEVTLQIHRGQVMRKMAARSLPQLVRMADELSACGILTLREADHAALVQRARTCS
jgi:FixJ family two-component response regulator